jgi:hypothetical protein
MFFRKAKEELAASRAEVAEKHRVLDYAAGFIDGQRSSMRTVGLPEDKLPEPLNLELRFLAIQHGFTTAWSAE